MNRLIALLLSTALSAIFSLTSTNSLANHFIGGQIEYECIGNNQFAVELHLYSWCGGLGGQATQTVSFNSTCGQSFTAVLPLITDTTTGQNSVNVSQVCPADSLNTECFGGSLPGMQRVLYRGIVTIAPPCNMWTISWNSCCRNPSVNGASTGSENIFLHTEMNSATNNCNSSPKFINKFLPFLPVNDTLTIAFTAFDPDGDSLSYRFSNALQNVNFPISYSFGYSGAAPVPGITIDSITGMVTVSPNIIGNYIIAVQVDEFDCNGQYLGSVTTDIYLPAYNGNGAIPQAASNIFNLSGQATLTGPNTLSACAGSNFCFDYTISDATPIDTLRLVQDVAEYWPGATASLSGTNPVTVSVCWTALPSCSGIWPLGLHLADRTCPIDNRNVMPIVAYIDDGVAVTGNQSYCVGDSTQLQAYGDTLVSWSVLSGDTSLSPPVFSCNPCLNPVAMPSVTTTYVATGFTSGTGCPTSDTITITPGPSFSLSLTDSSYGPSACEPDSIVLAPVPSLPGNYAFQWSGDLPLGNASDSTQNVQPNTIGQYQFAVTATSSFGCSASDSITIEYLQPSATIQANPAVICPGDTTQISINTNGWLPVNWNTDPTLVSDTGMVVLAHPNQSNTYTAVISDTSGSCFDTLSTSITVNVPTPVTIAGPDSFDVILVDTGCYTINSSAGSTIFWSINNGSIISGQSTDTICVQWNNNGQNGSVQVMVFESTGCIADTSFAVTLYSTFGLLEQAAPALLIAPNPNRGRFVIQSPAAGQMQVYNAVGELVFERSVNQHRNTIEASQLVPGVYLVQLTESNGRRFVQRLVIR